MDEAKLRQLLPGSGDLREMIEEVAAEFGWTDDVEIDAADSLLSKIVEWILDTE